MKRSILALSVPALFLASLSTGVLAQNAAVNCDTAKDDIAHLEHEKKSTDDRMVKGVLSIMPIGLVINAAGSATESTAEKQKEMDIDEYNEKIMERIAEIKKSCGM